MTPATRPLSALPPGTGLSRFIAALALGPGERLAKAATWKDTPQVAHALSPELFFKAAVAAGTTTDATWAGPLLQSGISSEALVLLRGMSALGALDDRVRRVPFNQLVPRDITTGAIGDFVGEGGLVPVAALDFDQVGPLSPHKMGVIVVLNKELVTMGGPVAERTIRTTVLTKLAHRLDSLFLDPAITATAARPASITNGATAVTSTGSTAAQITADIYSLLAAVTTGGPLVWIMKTATAARVQGAFGAAANLPQSLLGIPAVISDTSPQQIVLMDVSQILLADEGGFDVSVAQDASVAMDSAPTVAMALASLYQNNQVGIRTLRWLNWLRGHDEAVAYMTVTY